MDTGSLESGVLDSPVQHSDRPFVHLHCHRHYSLLDGASSINRLVERAKSHGMNALALTDHGNLHGALEFYQKAKAADINPIIGYEAYIAPGSRHQKDVGNLKEASYHLTLLAQNEFRMMIFLQYFPVLTGIQEILSHFMVMPRQVSVVLYL